MNLIINHHSDTGNRRVKLISDVKDAVFDYGYELPAGVANPAVKLILQNKTTYVLLNAQNPEELTKLIKRKLGSKVTIELPLSVFDSGVPLLETLGNMRTDLHRWAEDTNLRAFRKTEASQPFYPGEWSTLENGNYYPVLKKNFAALADLWAATMPTPGRLSHHSKLNFFNALLYHYRSHNNNVRL